MRKTKMGRHLMIRSDLERSLIDVGLRCYIVLTRVYVCLFINPPNLEGEIYITAANIFFPETFPDETVTVGV